MGLGNVVENSLYQHNLPYTSTSKQTNLSTMSIRGKEITTWIPVAKTSAVLDWLKEGGSA